MERGASGCRVSQARAQLGQQKTRDRPSLSTISTRQAGSTFLSSKSQRGSDCPRARCTARGKPTTTISRPSQFRQPRTFMSGPTPERSSTHPPTLSVGIGTVIPPHSYNFLVLSLGSLLGSTVHGY